MPVTCSECKLEVNFVHSNAKVKNGQKLCNSCWIAASKGVDL